MGSQWRTFRKILIIIITALIIIASTYRCKNLIMGGLRNQLISNLQDVSEQITLVLKNEIDDRQLFLKTLAVGVANIGPENDDKVIEYLSAYVDAYGTKRIGFIYPDGLIYTTDGFSEVLEEEDYFDAVLAGKQEISDVIMEDLGEREEINVFATPVFSNEEQDVIGMLVAVYRTTEFEEMLAADSFDGQGSSLVIKNDGSLIAAARSKNFSDCANIFDVLEASTETNAKETESLKRALSEGEDGYVTITLKGETYFLHYTPIDVEVASGGWYVLNSVPESVLNTRMQSIERTLEILMIIIIAVLTTAFVIYFFSYFRQRRQLLDLSYNDKLTGGYNYAYFLNRMRVRRVHTGFIISMDIDEFRIINNICGTLVGDELLRNIYKIIRTNLRPNELCARVNADRFIMFMMEDNNDKLVERIEKIRKEILDFEEKLNIPRVYPYFGVYKMNHHDEVEKGYGYANQAKHVVKGNRESYCFYENMAYKERIELKKLDDSFEEAIENRRFEVWYQPKFETKTGTIVSAEALVRWRDSSDNLIPPGKFIPLFEKNGKIQMLDEYVFDEVCRNLCKWKSEDRVMLPVSINISRASLYYPNIAERYRDIVEVYNIDPKYVQLEITESAAVENEKINSLLDKFHEYGFCLLLDDFGNGYSSLATLNEMKYDTLKLDKSLIDCIGERNGEILLYYVIKLAHNLGLHITAEGVETKSQVDFLKTLECDDIQGYYFSKPLHKQDYEYLIS